jgi:hypothetical protein
MPKNRVGGVTRTTPIFLFGLNQFLGGSACCIWARLMLGQDTWISMQCNGSRALLWWVHMTMTWTRNLQAKLKCWAHDRQYENLTQKFTKCRYHLISLQTTWFNPFLGKNMAKKARKYPCNEKVKSRVLFQTLGKRGFQIITSIYQYCPKELDKTCFCFSST